MALDVSYVGHSCYRLKSGVLNALVDPWLTDRLDRFWVHHPPQACDFDLSTISAIFITHHHIDHFHPDSLRKISRDALIFAPSPEKTPNFGGSGMGFKAIPWTLRHLGFHRIHLLAPFQVIRLGEMTVTCLPSKVGFPEVTYLMETDDGTVAFCGDSLLHPQTEDYLQTRQSRIDIAFIPCHCTSPAEPLLQRKPVPDAERLKTYSQQMFQRNLDCYNARYVVPSAFGWRIDGIDRTDRYDWANRSIFPFTPDEATSYLRARDQACFQLSPGDALSLVGGNLKPDIRNTTGRIYQSHELSSETAVPPFVPGEQMEASKEHDLNGLMARAGDEIVGTRYWLRATELGRKAQVKLSNGPDDAAVYLFDPAKSNPWQRQASSDLDYTVPYSWLHSDTLQRLLDSELLMSSSFGLWVSTDNWLSQVFHHPKYYVRHLTLNEELNA